MKKNYILFLFENLKKFSKNRGYTNQKRCKTNKKEPSPNKRKVLFIKINQLNLFL